MDACGEMPARVIMQRIVAAAKAQGMDFASLTAAVGIDACEIVSLMEGERSLVAEEYIAFCEILEVLFSMFMEVHDSAWRCDETCVFQASAWEGISCIPTPTM